VIRRRAYPLGAAAALIAAFAPAQALAAGTTATVPAPTLAPAAATVPAAGATGPTGPTTTTPTTTTTTTTTPPPRAATAKGKLYLPDAFLVHRQLVTVPGRWIHAVGIVRPYVAGQTVMVRAYVGRRLFKSKLMRLRPSRNRSYGEFTLGFSSPAAGTVTVTATHAATAQLKRFTFDRRLSALDEHVGFGSTGLFVDLIQQRLAALHFYIPQTGVYDEGTGLAIDAYHRLIRDGVSQALDGRAISFLLDGFGAFKVRFPKQGRHAEGDLSLQLLALVDGSKVEAIYPISSGKPSTPTILGSFQVYEKVPGYLPDGMYYSNFFIRGYAIHGYDPAPDYPASHGCMRLPIVDAISVYDWLSVGNWVDTYY
jgi:L,D-transpeptidase catalytic domain